MPVYVVYKVCEDGNMPNGFYGDFVMSVNKTYASAQAVITKLKENPYDKNYYNIAEEYVLD